MVYWKAMEDLAKADIFFFVTAIAVVAVTVVASVIGLYIVRILSDTKHITRNVREESDEILADVGAVRRFTERQGKRVGFVLGDKKKSGKKRT